MLSVNVITGNPSRYYKAGEEVPADKAAAFARYAVTAAASESGTQKEPPRPAANTAHRHAKKPQKGPKR